MHKNLKGSSVVLLSINHELNCMCGLTEKIHSLLEESWIELYLWLMENWCDEVIIWCGFHIDEWKDNITTFSNFSGTKLKPLQFQGWKLSLVLISGNKSLLQFWK